MHAKQTLHATTIIIQAIVGDIGACAKQLRESECGIPDDVINARINALCQASLDSLAFVILYGTPTSAVATSSLRNLCKNLKFIISEKQVLSAQQLIFLLTELRSRLALQYQCMEKVTYCLRLLLLEPSQASCGLCMDSVSTILEMLNCLLTVKSPAAIAVKDTLLRAISRVLCSTPPDFLHMKCLLACTGTNVSTQYYASWINIHAPTIFMHSPFVSGITLCR